MSQTNFVLATQGLDFLVTEGGDFLLISSTSGDTNDGATYDEYLRRLAALKKQEAALLKRQQEKLAQEQQLRAQIRGLDKVEEPPEEKAIEVKVIKHEIFETQRDLTEITNQLSEINQLLSQYMINAQHLRREREIEAILMLL